MCKIDKDKLLNCHPALDEVPETPKNDIKEAFIAGTKKKIIHKDDSMSYETFDQWFNNKYKQS